MPVSTHVYRKVQSSNSTASSFSDADTEPTATEPSGTGVIDLLDPDLGWGSGTKVPSYLEVVFFGAGTDTQTFDCRVTGFNAAIGAIDDLPLDTAPVYVGTILADVTAALGPTTGCDATAIAASNLMADTLTLNEGPAEGAFVSVISTGDDTPASLLLHTRGNRYLSFKFDMTGATSGNALVRPVD